MKVLFTSFLLAILFPLFSIAQEYSTSVTLTSQTDEILTLQSIALAEKKKTAEDMAIRSAFYTLLYRGVNGYNNGKPMVQHDNKYYTDKLLTTRYGMFVRQSTPLAETVRETNSKKYKAMVEVNIMIKSLVKDMVFEKVMDNPLSEQTMEDTKEEIGLPSITVVPYKHDEDTYKQILQNDFDRRIAVSRVQNGFNQLGVTTVDFEARLESILRSQDFNVGTERNMESRLLQYTGADVYVIVDLKKDINTQLGSRVSLIMKAYETASGNILATRQDWTNRFLTSDLDKLCVYAVDDQLKGFLADIAVNFARAVKDGTSVVLRISRGKGSTTTLSSPVGNSGTALSSSIRHWVRTHSQNGRYHLQGVVDNEMVFDDVKIPAKDEDGLPMDAAQFGDNLLFYISETLGVKCQIKVDGKTIYITLT